MNKNNPWKSKLKFTSEYFLYINIIIKENDNYLERLDPEHEVISFALRTYKEDEGVLHHILYDCQQWILGKGWH